MNLTDISVLKELLLRHGLRPTKSLGQHFLVSTKVVGAIIDRVRQESPASVLEVGPGPGVLTASLLELAPVTAVEVDPIAVSALSETAPAARVLHQDVLKTDLAALLTGMSQPRVVVSNMPYQITGPLLTAFCRCREHYRMAVLMMQREVAQKVLASSGSSDFGSISVYLQSRFEITPLVAAPAGAFFPPPKVDSSVLAFIPRSTWPGETAHERLVRAGFTQPRKTLLNNLVSAGVPKEAALAALQSHPESVRPHQLGLDSWATLAGQLHDFFRDPASGD